MESCVVVLPLLPYKPPVAQLHCRLGQRKCVFPCGRLQRHYFFVESQSAAFLVHNIQQCITPSFETDFRTQSAADIRRQIEPLQRRQNIGITIGADSSQTHHCQKHCCDSPRGLRIGPIARILLASPLLAHSPPAFRRSCALRNLLSSACSISRCISSDLS